MSSIVSAIVGASDATGCLLLFHPQHVSQERRSIVTRAQGHAEREQCSRRSPQCKSSELQIALRKTRQWREEVENAIIAVRPAGTTPEPLGQATRCVDRRLIGRLAELAHVALDQVLPDR